VKVLGKIDSFNMFVVVLDTVRVLKKSI